MRGKMDNGGNMNEIIPARATLNVTIGFHPAKICCDGCPLCLDDAWNRGRKRCIITNEIIHYKEQIGTRCPLDFEGENTNV